MKIDQFGPYVYDTIMTNPYEHLRVLPSTSTIVAERRRAFDAGRPETAPSLNLLIAEKMRRDRIERGVPLEGTGK